MTTYHVWLVDQVEPEVVRAEAVGEYGGALWFHDQPEFNRIAIVRHFEPAQWHRWAVVHDEADTVHI